MVASTTWITPTVLEARSLKIKVSVGLVSFDVGRPTLMVAGPRLYKWWQEILDYIKWGK